MASALNEPTSFGIPIQEVWDNYFIDREHGGHYEDLLVRAYLPLSKQVSDRVYATVPNNVDYEEVLQNGRIGLMDAIRAWKPEIASFRTYATLKIRSRILDGLRSADWLSRDMRRSVRTVQTGIVELEKQLNRTPTDEEVAAHLGLTVHDVQTALLNHSSSHVGSLDDLLPNRGGDGADSSLGAHITDHTDLSPHDHVEKKQDAELLRKAIETLPPRDRQILALYYYENLTLSNIGEILGVTESRICQVRSKALIVLHAKLSQAS
jgi:RNA polymerase sigma factor FliA